MTVTLGQQYNIGEKPTVILYTYINRHAGTPEKQLLFKEKTELTFSALVANPEKKKKSGSAPAPQHAARSEKIKIKITRRIHMSRRYASRRYAGVGPSRARTRIPTIRRLGQWVSLRKLLRFLRVVRPT